MSEELFGIDMDQFKYLERFYDNSMKNINMS